MMITCHFRTTQHLKNENFQGTTWQYILSSQGLFYYYNSFIIKTLSCKVVPLSLERVYMKKLSKGDWVLFGWEVHSENSVPHHSLPTTLSTLSEKTVTNKQCHYRTDFSFYSPFVYSYPMKWWYCSQVIVLFCICPVVIDIMSMI